MSHKNKTGRISTKLLPVIAATLALALTALIATVAAATVTYSLSLNLTDARLPNSKVLNKTIPGVVYATQVGELYNETVKRLAPWYFTADKEYRLIITNVTDTYNITREGSFKLAKPIYIDITAKANKTGGVTFKVTIPDYEKYYIAYWMVVLTVKAWNHEWLVLNFTTATPMPLYALLENFTGNKSILAINSTTFQEILDAVAAHNVRPNYFIANISRVGNIPPQNGTNAVLNVTYYKNGTVVIFKDSTVVKRYYVTKISPIYISKTVEYAWRLPYVQAFFLGLGKFSPTGKAESLSSTECTKYTVKAYLVTPEGEVKIFSGKYNETFTDVVKDKTGKYYCMFGPIYYVTALFKGLTSEEKTHDTITYIVKKVATQSPYSDVYLKIMVIRPVALGGETVTVASITAKPRSLINYGVVALITNSTWAVEKKVNATAVGLFGWTINGTRKVLDIAPILALPLISVRINKTSLKTLLNKTLPYYMVEKLEYKWFVNGKLISTGRSATLVGKLEAETYITDHYKVKVSGGKPKFTLLGKYSLRIWYGNDAVAFVNVTDLISKAVNHTISEVTINGTIPVALVPIVVYLHKLEPETNVTNASSLPIELVQGKTPIRVVIERAEVARGPYYSYMVASPMANKSKVVITPGPFTVYGIRIRPAVLFLPTPEPVKVNLTGKIAGTKVVTAKITLEKPTTELAAYYYKFNVYYGDVRSGIAIFAIGAKVYSTPPSALRKYCLRLRTGDYLCAVAYPVGGNKILYEFNKYVAQYYWNETNYWHNVMPKNVTVLEPEAEKGIVVWKVRNITSYVCHVAVAVTPLIAYFETLYGKLISDELPSGVSAFVRVIEVSGGEEHTIAALSARSVYEKFIAVPVELNKTGWPVTEASKTELKFVLDYEGYELTAINKTTGEPLLLKLDKVLTVKVVHVTFPLVRTTLKVVSADNKPLVGFVVEVRSIYTGDKLWMAITNDKGEVYIGLLPAGKKVKIIVRTLKPKDDKKWFEMSTATNKTLAKTKNNYVEYALWMTGNRNAIVYTLGTRGIADAGVVVNVTLESIPGKSLEELKKIIEKDGWVDLPEVRVLNVRPLKIYVVYVGSDGKYHLLKTITPVYPCGIPGYCSAIIYNTTLVISDTVYRNASRIIPYRVCRSKKLSPCDNYTADFRVIAISWMKPVFERLAKAFEKAASKALDEAKKHEEDFKTWLEWMKNYAANETFALTAEYLAMHSTSSPDAVFTLPVMLGKDMEKMHIARVWIPGQLLHMKVYYMGYEIFNGYAPVPPYNETVIVTPTGTITYKSSVNIEGVGSVTGAVVLVASVKPVTFKIVTADTRKPAGKLYLGLLFADALFKVYEVVPSGIAATPVELMWPVLEPFNLTKPVAVIHTAKLKVSINASVTTVKTTVPTTTFEWKNKTRYIGKVLGVIVPLPVDLSIVAVNYTNKTGKIIERYLLPLATNVSGVYNVTLGMPENYTEINVPAGSAGIVVIEVKPLKSIFDIYPVLVYEVNVTPPATVKLTESETAKNATWSGREVYKYNISSVIVEFNTTKVDKLSKLYVKVYAKYDNKSVLLVTRNVTTLAKRLLGRIFNITVAVPRSIIEVKIPRNVSNVTPVVEINATGLKGTLEAKVVITTGAGLVVNLTNVTLGKFANGTSIRVENVVRVKPAGPWKRYFGSPMLVIVPVGPSGEVTLLLPEWTLSVAGSGARIARIYIIGVNGTPGVVVETPPEVHVISTSIVPEVRLLNYTILNLVELPAKIREVNYTLTSKHVTMSSDVVYLLGENATSTLLYKIAKPSEVLYDVYKIKSPVILPAALVTQIKVENSPKTSRGYAILVKNVTVDSLVVGPAAPTVINKSKTGVVKLTTYMAIMATKIALANKTDSEVKIYDICGLVLASPSYVKKHVVLLYNPELTVSIKYWPPKMTFYEVTPSGVKVVKVEPSELVRYEDKLADLKEHVNKTIDLTTYGGIIPKLTYSYTVLPLMTVFTWSTQTVVPYATVAVFKSANESSLCRPIAISFTDARGNLTEPLPAGKVVRVFWYDSYVRYLETMCTPAKDPKASFAALDPRIYMPIVIYDNTIREDVNKLGNATETTAIRTWTYMMKVTVKATNPVLGTVTPVPGAIVIVRDAETGGEYFYAVGITSSDGSAEVRDVRLGVPASIVPPLTYVVDVYMPVAGYSCKIEGKVPEGVKPICTIYGGNAIYVLHRGSTSPVVTVPVSTLAGPYPASLAVKAIVKATSAVGRVVVPLNDTEVTYTITIPAVVIGNMTGHGIVYMIPLSGIKAVFTRSSSGITSGGGVLSLGTIYVPARGKINITVTLVSWRGIPLGWTFSKTLTKADITTSATKTLMIQVTIPAARVEALALSANKVPLGSNAIMSVTCMLDGKPIVVRTVKGDRVTVFLPIPYDVYTGKKSIVCNVTAEAFGAKKSITITVPAKGGVVTREVIVPVSGIVLPGGAFIPMQTLITALVVALIVIIIVVIGLMEYSTWRRKRLVSIIGAPGPAR